MSAVGADGVDRLLADYERSTLYEPHTPTAKQRAFLSSTALEVLYGGAARGGKTDALLMAALQGVRLPGYAAMLLRRTYADLLLPDAIMDRAHAWLSQTQARWHEKEKAWFFPTSAAPSRIGFGYLDTERDKYRYQGAKLQFVGFDELSQFLESQYLYLFSRLTRSAGSGVPLRMRAASNPGGVGHAWVRERFLDAPSDRVFIPATIDDNPHEDRDAYLRSLERLDPITHRQLRYGDWTVDDASLVFRFRLARNTAWTAPAFGERRAVLGIDYGFVDATAFVVLAYDRQVERKVYVLESEKREGLTPSEAAERTRSLDDTYKFDVIVGDTGGLGKGYAEEARRRFRVPVRPAEKHNRRGYLDLLNGALAEGDLLVLRDGNDDLIEELESLVWNERRTDASSRETHATDALLYAFRECRPADARVRAWRETKEPPDPRSDAQREMERLVRAQLAADRDSW